MMFSRRFTQQQLVEYGALMLRVIGLVAVIGLTLTAITGCTTSDDASSTVASDDASSTVASNAKESAIEKSEVVSLGQDCVTVDNEITKQNEYTRDNGIEIRTQEWFDEALKTWARIWPQMNDPDLKSIFRELANTTDADDKAMDNWIAYRTICDTDRYG
ncbi:MAG: hypothetical protein K0U31_05550 [Actinomycetia bacterium]|jgi:hypothetical protein|nr:hypothetical protein [Actinomycetes bacterium]